MIKALFVFAMLLPGVIQAQTTRADVVILGNGDAAYSSALQVSRSGVSVVLLTQRPAVDLSDIKTNKSAEIAKIYEQVRQKEIDFAAYTRKVLTAPKKKKGVREKVDSIKLFKVITDTVLAELKLAGNRWEAKLAKDISL